MEREKYIKEIYAKWWNEKRISYYGFSEYDENLSKLVQGKKKNGKALDVGVGNGYPLGEYFMKTGYDVYGIDVSELLIDECKKKYPEIKCEIGNAESLMYDSDYFDLVYCFHTTWYIKDLGKAINEMYRVCKENGVIIFDVQNFNNRIIKDLYKKELLKNSIFGKGIHLLKNIAKFIVGKKYIVWNTSIYNFFHKAEDIYTIIDNIGVSNWSLFVREKEQIIKVENKKLPYTDRDRLVFCLFK